VDAFAEATELAIAPDASAPADFIKLRRFKKIGSGVISED
jgi:hypothetical protein